MSKPIVNEESCIGCGTCQAICPEVFEVQGDSKSHVLEADYDALKDKIEESITACPVQAISR